ncbi:MAG: hypothetical protein IH612_20520, partial [Desulfofustis sp.]|nr:hypothetical protein [Desulfofustis sp.]
MEIDRLEVQDTTGGTLFSLIHLRAGVSLDQDQLTLAELRVQTPSVQVDLTGSVRMSGDWPLSLSGNWSAEMPGCSPVQGTAAIDGSAADAAFSLSVVEPLRAEMAGTFTGLPARLSWELKASGRQLDPAIICADWPVATADLVLAAAGTTSEYHGTLEITAELAERPSFSAALPFAGTVSELTLEQGRISGAGGSGQLSGRLSWQEGVSWQAELDLTGLDPGNFQSSLAGALDLTVSTKGGFSGAGLSWQADLKRLHYQTTVLAEPLAGTAQLVGTAQGVSGDVQLSIARSALAAQAEIDWTEGVTWDGRLALEAFDPSVIDDLPSGAIDAVILSHGHRGGQQIEVAATLERLSGRLAGYDLQGGGAASYRDGRLLVNDLQVSNGGNRIVLNGAIDELIDLQFSVDGTDLERLYAPLRGDLNLVGRLSGTRSAPILDGRFETTTLFYHDYGLESGSGTIRFGHDGPETIDVSVQVHGLTGSGVSVQQGSLVIAGSRADHRVVLDLRGAIGQLTATLAGALTEDWQWAGMLREAGVVSSDHGSWRQ